MPHSTTHHPHASRWRLLLAISGLLFLISCQQAELGANTATAPTAAPLTAVDEQETTGLPTTAEPTLLPPAIITPIPTSTMAAISSAPYATPATMSAPADSGALIRLSMQSEAGILLDDFPAAMRDRVAASLSAQPAAYWREIAAQQLSLTHNRLHFRNFFYPGKGQLPLPPEALWAISIDSAPVRQTVNGHDLLLVAYTFSSTLLSDTLSPAQAEPALAEIGGIWEEPFILPLDPFLLFQRTGNACLNEGGFPPNSYDSENTNIFYDYTCTAASGGPAGCHRTQLAPFSCQEGLNLTVGTVTTVMRFERLPWDPAIADEVRVAEVISLTAPDLIIVGDDLNNTRIVYRYFPTNSCAVGEGCINGTGWRRLLQFDATAHNLGAVALNIGPVVAENPLTNMFQYNACHDHFHFNNYGEFELGANNQPSKQAFCVESTSRFSNNELSPLNHDFSCQNQGIQAGWVDEYGAGLDCQWIDITDIPFEQETVTLPLTFRFNTDKFLCEGIPIVDENGNPLWEPSGLRTPTGLPISRPQCTLAENWAANNEASRPVTLPVLGSFVTENCSSGEQGSLRNCGFTPQTLPELSPSANSEATLRCQPGTTVQLSCQIGNYDDAPQVLRLCERSAVLGTGTACAYNDALLNTVLDSASDTISFTCPLLRDANEPGGDYSLYTAPLFTGDGEKVVSCSPVGP